MRGASPRRFALAAGALVIVAALALALKSCLSAAPEGDRGSKAGALELQRVDATVGGPGTPEYNHMIEELNLAGAELARGSGDSFASTPVGARTTAAGEPAAGRPAVGEPPFQPLSEAPARPALRMPPAPEGRPAPVRNAGGREVERRGTGPDLVKAISADLKSLAPAAPGAFKVEVVEAPGTVPGGRDDKKPDSPPMASSGLAPGDLLSAVTDLAVNSDVEAPVLAKVVQGPAEGLRLMGGFKREGRILSITFDKAVSPDGTTLALKAVAVDSRANSPAVAGKVDAHYLERWGALLAASFLEGLGQAMTDRGTTVRAYGDVVVAERARVPMGEVALEALGRVGGRAANRLETSFERPPTVTLPSGSLIGVLIIEAPGGGS